MKQPGTPPSDDFQIRCPKLGHQIYFSYCRQENIGAPCFKTVDCWYPYFKVEEYLRLELTPKEWQNTFEKPVTPKIITLVEKIEKAKRITGKKRSEETAVFFAVS